jgi:hypothetical protein
MGRFFSLLLIVILIAVAALLGQSAGFYDVPALRGATALLPFARQPQAAAVPTPPSVEPRLSPSPSPATAPAPAKPDQCSAASPSFVHGAAALKAALGARMGDASECERVVDTAGNTEQKTTTGLAYYRAGSNVTVFTNGFEHWALTPNGLVHWTTGEVEPPPNAEPAT